MGGRLKKKAQESGGHDADLDVDLKEETTNAELFEYLGGGEGWSLMLTHADSKSLKFDDRGEGRVSNG